MRKKTSTKRPISIKIILIIAPIVREIRLEKRASNHTPMSNPLVEETHLYCLQGENKVLKSKGIEK